MSAFSLEIAGRRVGRFRAVEAADGSATPAVHGAARAAELVLLDFQPEAAFSRLRSRDPVGPGAILLRDGTAGLQRKWRFQRVAIGRRTPAGLQVRAERLARA